MKRIVLGKKFLAAAIVVGLVILQALPLRAQTNDSASRAMPDATNSEPVSASNNANDSTTQSEPKSFHLKHGPVVAIGGAATLKTGEAAEVVVAIGGNAKAGGKVQNAVVAIGGNAEARGNVGDAVVAVGGSAIAMGRVGDAIVAVLGDAEAQGEVGHSVVAVMGDVRIGSNSVVRGDVVSVGGTVQVEPGGQIKGRVTEVGVGGHPFFVPLKGLAEWFKHGVLQLRLLAPQAGFCWVMVGAFFLFYLFIAVAFPRPVAACVNELAQRPAATFLFGLLTKLLVPLIVLVLVATGIGVLVVPFLLAAVFIGAAFGKVALFQYLGRSIVRAFGVTVPAPALALLTGFVLITMLYLVPVLSVLVYLLVGLWGIGAAVMATFGGARKETAPRPSVTTSPPLSDPPVAPPTNPIGAAAYATGAAAEFVSETGVPPPPYAPEAGLPPRAMPVPPPSARPVPASALTLPRAGFWERMGAAFLDVIFVAILVGVIVHIPDGRSGRLPLGLLVALAYFAGMWAWRGTTIGGIVLNLKVVRLDDQPVSFLVALVRGLAAVFSIIVFFCGFLWVLFDRDKQAWHDKLAGTVVVRTQRGIPLVCL